MAPAVLFVGALSLSFWRTMLDSHYLGTRRVFSLLAQRKANLGGDILSLAGDCLYSLE